MTYNEMDFFPTSFMLQAHHEDNQHPPPSLNPILPLCSPHNFHGVGGVASLLGKRSISFSGIENGEEDLSDDGSQAREKKRRLSMEQVKTLEKNFELANKLEPERKIELARALGLQPRQVAIWFQNRRARWKTKQLEKDYDLLKAQFDAIKADNDALEAQNKKLQAEISALKGREPTESINLNKETEGSCSNRSENSSEINLDISRTSASDSHLSSDRSRTLFQTAISRPTSTVQQRLQNSSRSDSHCHKIQNPIQEESICQIFNSIDDQPSFWPWSENQQFH